MTEPNLAYPHVQEAWIAYRVWSYSVRPCWICNAKGNCQHRERSALSVPGFWRFVRQQYQQQHHEKEKAS